MTPEAKVKKEVDAILKRHGIWYFKPVSMGYGSHGIPDYVCCVQGWFLGIECKATERDVPTTLQLACHQHIVNAQGVIFVAHANNLHSLEGLIVLMKTRITQRFPT